MERENPLGHVGGGVSRSEVGGGGRRGNRQRRRVSDA
jgi:hypothetical protein